MLAGEKAFKQTGNWLPDDTLEAFREYLVGIKGPLTTPVGGGIRSLNVALRQMLDLYVCLRPVRYFKGVPSPVKHPEKVDMVIFRENTEDIYAGIEFARNGDAQKVARVPRRCSQGAGRSARRASFKKSRRVPATSSRHRHQADLARGQRAAGPQRDRVRDREQAQERDARAQGQHHEVHRGRVPRLGLRAREARVRRRRDRRRAVVPDPDGKPGAGIVIKDAIADITLQQILTRPDEFDVIATPNLNGDYLSDALAAQVGGIGIAPGGNINYVTGHAVFEATHGTAPKYAEPGQGQSRAR